MKRFYTLLSTAVALISMSSLAFAQSVDQEAFDAKIYNSFVNFYKGGVTEKIYIQTDKPYYSAGENIWFKGYLVNTITHTNSTDSKFIYVELTDRRDSLFTRIKVMKDEFGFHNAITLPNDMVAGDYTLTAYTKWMQNWSPDLFCHKKIEIANAIDDAVTLNASYTRDEDSGETEVKVKINSAATPAANASVVCSYQDGDNLRKATAKISEDKSLSFTLPANFSSSAVSLSCADAMLKFDKTIFVPQFDDELDLQFFPEGGVLLAGNGQTVAFKAIGSDGFSRDVEGELFGEEEGKILDFKSEYKGMGRLMMLVQPHDKYYVTVKDPNDATKSLRFNLPEVQVSGAIIKCAIMGEKLMCQTIITDDIDPTRVGVIFHARGKVINSQIITSSTTVKSVPIEPLPEGIVTISLINLDTYNTIAERRVFIAPKRLDTSITPDKSSYRARSLVRLSISVKDGGQPAQGDYAISVTDNSAVDISKATETIESNLLMSSDLKGYIEEPASYFTDNRAQDYSRQELIMLTHGWRRFSLDRVLHDDVDVATIPMEKEQVVRGHMKGFFGNRTKNSKLVIFNPTNKFFDVYNLENTHKFELSGFDYPDSTTLILQAVGKGGSNKSMTLYVEDEVLNTPKYIFPQPVIGREQKIIPTSYITQSLENYYYQGGMRVINIDAVTVIGSKKADATDTGLFAALNPTNSMSGEQLQGYSELTLFEVLQYFPEVQIKNNEEYVDGLFLRGYDEQPIVFVNELETDIDFIKTISVDQVESIQLLKGTDAAALGPSADSGAIVVKLKDGASLASAIPMMPSMVHLNMLGYKRPTEYYQPKYDVAEVRNSKTADLRTTIYWNPTIKIGESGSVAVEFYTADKSTTYDIVLEGITDDGKVVRSVGKVERK